MPKFTLVDSDNPILLNKTKPIRKMTKTMHKTIKGMARTLLDLPNAIALAAPQIGSDLRVFVYRQDNEILSIVNPHITWSSMDDPEEVLQDEEGKAIPKIIPGWEGCLSFPGKAFLVLRPSVIEVVFQTEKMVYKKMMLSGMGARVFMHETDHLDGILASSIANNERDTTIEGVESISPIASPVEDNPPPDNFADAPEKDEIPEELRKIMRTKVLNDQKKEIDTELEELLIPEFN